MPLTTKQKFAGAGVGAALLAGGVLIVSNLTVGPPTETPPLASYSPPAMTGVATSGVGYDQFPGRPDPWPGNKALQPNAVLRQAYIDRYGTPPGCPPAMFQAGDVLNGVTITEPRPAPDTRIGYCAEMFSVNGTMLKAMEMDGQIGPADQTNEPTLTEMTDASFVIPRRSTTAKVYWWEAANEGAKPETAIRVNDPARAHGSYTTPSPHGWPVYYWNDYDGTTPPPQPVCGNGTCDNGESAASCFADCHCGNGLCDGGETPTVCPDDCPLAPPQPVCRLTRTGDIAYDFSNIQCNDPAWAADKLGNNGTIKHTRLCRTFTEVKKLFVCR
jgi:hypothetical protein